eukprot:15353795-Ditylum_brightwellii.AAC.1
MNQSNLNPGMGHAMQLMPAPVAQPQPNPLTYHLTVLTPEQKLVMQQDMMERECQSSVLVAAEPNQETAAKSEKNHQTGAFSSEDNLDALINALPPAITSCFGEMLWAAGVV